MTLKKNDKVAVAIPLIELAVTADQSGPDNGNELIGLQWFDGKLLVSIVLPRKDLVALVSGTYTF